MSRENCKECLHIKKKVHQTVNSVASKLNFKQKRLSATSEKNQ